MYYLVVTDDYSRFTWVSFLATKDESSGILKSFITRIENQVDQKVKVIRCDNGSEFKNREMNQFCEMKCILRKLSVARTPYQNRVAGRRNRTLIEAAKTMLADSKLPTTFWAEAVNTACYVQNRVLVVKPHNKTPYEHFHGRTPTLSFMRSFGCPVTILNTIDHLEKFNGKANEGFFVGYSLNSKDFRVFNSRTRIVEENLHIRFSENTPNAVGSRPDWLFDIDALTRTMNYEPIVAGTQSNGFASTKASDNAYPKSSNDDGSKPSSDDGKNVDEDPRKEHNEFLFDLNMAALEDVIIFNFSSDDEDNVAVSDMNNLDTTIQIEEEVYVCQPIGFKDPDFLDRVYKVKKHCMDYIKLLELGMKPCQHMCWTMDFKEEKLTSPYSSKDTKVIFCWSKSMWMISSLVQQGRSYAMNLREVKNASTLMGTQKPLLKDEDGEYVDVHMYRSMIGSLMYLTSSRPDIMFAVCACARYQVNPYVSHLYAVKSIFRYLKGQPKLGLWYPRDSPFDFVAYTDSDYARASLDRKSTTGGCQFLGSIPTDPHHTPTILQPSSSQPQKTQTPRKPKKDTQLPQPSGPTESVSDKAVHKELGDSLVRAATTASSLEAEQDSSNITKTQYKGTPIESSSQGTDLGGGPRCQETMRDTIAQTMFERVTKLSNDSLLARGNTLRSNEDNMKLNELMQLCTNLQNRVLDLEKTKTTQKNKIGSLKRRFKRLEKRNRSRTHKLNRLYKVGLSARGESSGEEESGEEVFVAEQEVVSTTAITKTITVEENTLAQALKALRTLKPKAKGIVFQEPGKSTTTTTFFSQQSQDKGKGIMIEEPVKPKKKDQIRLDEEVALKLQAKFDEEERLARERAEKEQEANIALIKRWDDIQVKIARTRTRRVV
uniref:Ribonuclease H-like domain-containing protein n=1 Tax=Tanacetum cinerariifolium TaxID=118510 RepID=A0A6L2JFE8_TANCI|nr:ribonuclease H-like domain-containing protein [Tanacetum cinerariifolium]